MRILERKEMSVYELLAAAREAQGTNYVKGDGIFCEKRFRKETAHMVEFLIREGQDAFGGKGEYHRKFLTEKEYQNILLQVKQGKIWIKRHAQKGLPTGKKDDDFVRGTQPPSGRKS